MQDEQINIRPREEKLKKKWAGISDRINIDYQQNSFDTLEREENFIRAQFPSDEEYKRYQLYREEWHRRPKEFDPGESPLAVTCELVSSCNLGCTMCYTITEEFQSSVVGAQKMLPWPIVKAIIDECAELGVPSMLFSWRGESSIYHSRYKGKAYKLPDVLAYAREKGILEITCLTNGQLLDRAVAERIVEAEPSWISFSIDGLEKPYNNIRTPPNKRGTDYNAFETVTNNIKQLIEIRDQNGKTRPQIRTNSIFPAIADDPQAYHAFMKNLGVGWITVNEIWDFREDWLPEHQIMDDWGCQYPFQRLTVSANGTIVPCTGAHNEEAGLVLGRYCGTPPKIVVNLEEGKKITVDSPQVTLKEAWNSKKLANIRKLHENNQRKEIKNGCRNCRHGMKKNGVEWLPEDWDLEEMKWKEGSANINRS